MCSTVSITCTIAVLTVDHYMCLYWFKYLQKWGGVPISSYRHPLGVPISSYWHPLGVPISSYWHPLGGANKAFLFKIVVQIRQITREETDLNEFKTKLKLQFKPKRHKHFNSGSKYGNTLLSRIRLGRSFLKAHGYSINLSDTDIIIWDQNEIWES